MVPNNGTIGLGCPEIAMYIACALMLNFPVLFLEKSKYILIQNTSAGDSNALKVNDKHVKIVLNHFNLLLFISHLRSL